MAQKNTTAYVILGLLSHEEGSGYDLKKKIDMAISQFWEVSYGQLYPTLKQLEEEGSIIGMATPSVKGPDRIVYRITAKGKEKLTAWLSWPDEDEHVRYEILLKLFFGNLSSPSASIEKIKAFHQRHTADLERINLFEKNLQKVFDENEDHLYYYLTALFGEHIYKAYLEWADEAVALIEKNMMQSEKREGSDQ